MHFYLKDGDLGGSVVLAEGRLFGLATFILGQTADANDEQKNLSK